MEGEQYLISNGKEISSRAVRASYLSAFTEVILGCEIMNNEFKHAIDDISTGGKIPIYLHLRKYFCGTLFTPLCFLERPKDNPKLGDVCLHGKEGFSFRFAGNSLGSFPLRCYGLLGCTPWQQQAFKMQQASRLTPSAKRPGIDLSTAFFEFCLVFGFK